MMHSLEQSLGGSATDYVDVYFNHAVNDVDRLKNPEWREFTARAKQQGRSASWHVRPRRTPARVPGLRPGHGRRGRILVAYNFGRPPLTTSKFTPSLDFVAASRSCHACCRKVSQGRSA